MVIKLFIVKNYTKNEVFFYHRCVSKSVNEVLCNVSAALSLLAVRLHPVAKPMAGYITIESCNSERI